MFQAFAPHVLPLTVEEGIANGVAEVRKAVRYQIKYGARVIKVSASGGVMSHTGPAGARQYSTRSSRRSSTRPTGPACRWRRTATATRRSRVAIECGIDCIEHGSLMSDETLDLMVERGTFLVATTYLADGMDMSHAAPELQAKAAEVFPRARQTISNAIDARRQDRLRHRRSGHPPRPQRQGAGRSGRPGHDPAAGASAPPPPSPPS